MNVLHRAFSGTAYVPLDGHQHAHEGLISMVSTLRLEVAGET
jgi:hypothetical protein